MNYQSVLARLIQEKFANISITHKTLEFGLEKEAFQKPPDPRLREDCLGVNEVEETLDLRADSHQQETEEQEKKPEEETSVRGVDQNL